MKYALVTVSDSLVNTSMPYNEFAVYRQEHRPDCLHFYIALFETCVSRTVPYPEGLVVFRCGGSPRRLRQAMREIREQCSEDGREILVHLHEGKSVLFFRLAAGPRYRRRTVYTVHSLWPRYSFHNKVFSMLAALISRRTVCVSRTAYEAYPAVLKRLLKERITWVRNGADCGRTDRAGGEEASPAELLRMICVGRMIPSKNQAVLLRAVKENPGCSLTLVGGGAQEEELRALAGELGIADRVRFAGYIPRDEVFREMKRHDLYVSASEYEGLPVSVLEAMCCRIPCAVSDIPSHREIAEQCPSLVLAENTEEGWNRVIRGFAGKTPEERKRAGEANREAAERAFSLERMHRDYDAVYAAVLQRRQG